MGLVSVVIGLEKNRVYYTPVHPYYTINTPLLHPCYTRVFIYPYFALIAPFCGGRVNRYFGPSPVLEIAVHYF